MDRLRRVIIRPVVAIGGMAALSLASVPGAQAAAMKANSAAVKIRGVDISAYQHTGSPIDWDRLAAEGIRFVGIKVSEGTYYANPYYRSDAGAAAQAGLAVLSYVFANPGSASGPATASFALKAEGSVHTSLPLVVDLENDPYKQQDDCYGLHAPAMVAWISAFIARAKALTGHVPAIYTTAAWWQECTGDTARFRRAALWLAAFGGTPPTAPPPWSTWTFLQYTNQGTLPGLGQTDLDYYHPTSTLTTLTPHKPPKKQPKKKVKAHPKPKPKPHPSKAPKNPKPTKSPDPARVSPTHSK